MRREDYTTSYLTSEKWPWVSSYCCNKESSCSAGLESDIVVFRLLITVIVESPTVAHDQLLNTMDSVPQSRATIWHATLMQHHHQNYILYTVHGSIAIPSSESPFSNSLLRAAYWLGCVTHSPPPTPSPFFIP